MKIRLCREHFEIAWRRVRNIETALAEFGRLLQADPVHAGGLAAGKTVELVEQLSDFRTVLVDHLQTVNHLQAPVEESDA